MTVERPRGPRPFFPTRGHRTPLEVASPSDNRQTSASPALAPPPYTFHSSHPDNHGAGSAVIEHSSLSSQEDEMQERIKYNIVTESKLSDTVYLPANCSSRRRPRPLPNPPTVAGSSKVAANTTDEGNGSSTSSKSHLVGASLKAFDPAESRPRGGIKSSRLSRPVDGDITGMFNNSHTTTINGGKLYYIQGDFLNTISAAGRSPPLRPVSRNASADDQMSISPTVLVELLALLARKLGARNEGSSAGDFRDDHDA